MNRADLRRQQKQVSKNPTYTYTAAQLDEILGKVHKEAYKKAFEDSYTKSVEDSIFFMLAIPCNILSSEGYWEKTAKKKLPIFLKECMELFKCYQKNIVNQGQLDEHLKLYTDYDNIIQELRKEAGL